MVLHGLFPHTCGRGQATGDVCCTYVFELKPQADQSLLNTEVIGNCLSGDVKRSHRIDQFPSSSHVLLSCISEKKRCHSFIFLLVVFLRVGIEAVHYAQMSGLREGNMHCAHHLTSIPSWEGFVISCSCNIKVLLKMRWILKWRNFLKCKFTSREIRSQIFVMIGVEQKMWIRSTVGELLGAAQRTSSKSHLSQINWSTIEAQVRISLSWLWNWWFIALFRWFQPKSKYIKQLVLNISSVLFCL